MAKKMLHHCGILARQKGFERVGLCVGIENEAAKTLYQKLGFQDSGIGEYQVRGTYTKAPPYTLYGRKSQDK
jgi:ribosomal protein S18 acetylase RimI-like enzyme